MTGRPIYAAGRVVGEVAGNVFRKRVRASVHMLREPRGWALDVQSLRDAAAAGATACEIVDSETGTVYTAALTHLRLHGFEIDRGFGRQWVCPIEYWETRRAGAPMQLSLFSEAGR